MNIIGALIPISLALGGLGLIAFVWSLRSGQFDDLEGDQHRALFEDEPAPNSGPKSGIRNRH
ncbi:MAG: cbb3-type cytochrome oxidase assembly protein CcoS [Pseudomonadota bacterium]